MSKYNRGNVRPQVTSPVATAAVPALRTFEGGNGYARDAKGELYLLAITHMGDLRFYDRKPADNALQITPRRRVETARIAPNLTSIPWQETPAEQRMAELAQLAAADPGWLLGFTGWLRNGANMRAASIVVAAEGLRGMLREGLPGGRKLIASALQRADEPGELLAYWISRYGRNLPIALKRGIADAIFRLYTEYGLLKYDSQAAALRFGDVVELVNPRYHLSEYGTWRDDLYRYAIERRHNRDNPVPYALPMIRANVVLRHQLSQLDPVNYARLLCNTDQLRDAGITWEDALSLAGPHVPKADLWTALIPLMGYMALLRNLRNFDEADVPDSVASVVAARLADPEQVASSRQFPFRFLSAYRAVPSLRWSWPLEQALNASLANVPVLGGRTLIMVDVSTSMNDPFSADGVTRRWDAAALFGIALGQHCAHADVVAFSGRNYYNEPRRAVTRVFPLERGESLLRSLDRWKTGGWFLGGGTDTDLAVLAHYAGHDRVVIVTDEQTTDNAGGVSAAVPPTVPLYTWNLAGYQAGHAPSGGANRHTFGGLNDQAFGMIAMLEAGRNATWPWQAPLRA